jgi:hypothetical protein
MASNLEIGALVTLGVAVVGGAVWVGQLRGEVNALEKRVDGLETRVDPLRTLKVGKGDLCLEMLQQWGGVKDPKRQESLQKQWEGSGCDSLPAAAGAMTNAVQEIPEPPEPKPEH